MVAKHVAPIAAQIDETDRFPLELVKLFGEMRFGPRNSMGDRMAI